MTPDQSLSLASLVCFGAGAALAVGAFRWEVLGSAPVQLLVAGAGLLLKTAAIGMTCMSNQTHFFNSPSEVFGLFAWALAFSYLVALAVSAVRLLGLLILPLVVLLLLLSQFSDTRTVDPGLPTGWLFAVHILSAFLGYGLFLTSCGASVLYLEQNRLLKRKAFGFLFKNLPSLERLEHVELVCAWAGLALFTVAIGTGAIQTRALNKEFWLDSKVLAAQLTWAIFATLIVLRAAKWLYGRALAKFVLAGAALVLVTFVLSHPFARPTAVSARETTSARWSELQAPRAPCSRGGDSSEGRRL